MLLHYYCALLESRSLVYMGWLLYTNVLFFCLRCFPPSQLSAPNKNLELYINTLFHPFCLLISPDQSRDEQSHFSDSKRWAETNRHGFWSKRQCLDAAQQLLLQLIDPHEHTSCQSYTQTKSQSTSCTEYCLTVGVQFQEQVSDDWSSVTRWVTHVEVASQRASVKRGIRTGTPHRNIWTRRSKNIIYQRFNPHMLLKSSPYWQNPFLTNPYLRCTHSQRVFICSGANQPQLRRRISNPYCGRAAGCRSILCCFHFRELSCGPSLFYPNVQQGFALAPMPSPTPLPPDTDGGGQ